MIPKTPPCFVIGGRFGDIIQLLPCFKAVHDRTGMKPFVVSSSEYASVYDGVSYVDPYPVQAHWYAGIPKMKQLAQELAGSGIICQFWQDKPSEDSIGYHGATWTTLQCHGHEHGVNLELDPDYGTSMARRCGFTRDEWTKLPLVFDRRNKTREDALVSRIKGSSDKPIVLLSLGGISSPFGFLPEVMNPLLKRFNKRFNLVDLTKIRAIRIYDILGLMDAAVGMLTADTYSLHLALGSKLPYVGFTVDGWTTSVPKGNCALEVKYNSTPQRVHEVLEVMESWG